MKKTPENIVKKEIKDWLTLHGFFHFHLMAGLGSYPGTPDRIAIKDGKVLFIEIKGPTGKISENQTLFGAHISGAYGHYVIARGHEDLVAYCRRRGWL